MILAEQQPWIKHHRPELETANIQIPLAHTIVEAIREKAHSHYSQLRRLGRKLSYDLLHKQEKPQILEFNAFALVDRYIRFRQSHPHPEHALDEYLLTVRSDIKTWVKEFLRKVEVDSFTITLNLHTGKLTNDAYRQFDDDLIDMMISNEKDLEKQGKNITRAQADTLSMKRVRDWASTAPVGSTNLSISPRYEESSEELIDDPYEFVFFREITHRDDRQVTIYTKQYKTWLTYDSMQDILALAGWKPKPGERVSPELIASVAHPLSNDFTQHDLALLLNGLSIRNDILSESAVVIQNVESFEESLQIAEDFLVEVVTRMLSTIHHKTKGLSPSNTSRIIEEAINFSMRYMLASKEKNIIGETHDVSFDQLMNSFTEYIDIKYFGKKTTKEEKEHVIQNVSISLGGFLGQVTSTTQCYGSMFGKLSLKGSSFTAPNYSFAGLGSIRPENALLLKKPMNCPFCKKKVLVWKHQNRIQCSWCGRFKECGTNESYGETYAKISHNKESQHSNSAKKNSPLKQEKVESKQRINPGMWLFSFFAPRYILQT